MLEVFHAAGGLTPGASPRNIQVVRGHVADGRPPEAFDVDLEAILSRDDPQTNLRLQPFDQIYVGQSRRASLEKCLPPWLRPLYEGLCGLLRPHGKPPPGQVSGQREGLP